MDVYLGPDDWTLAKCRFKIRTRRMPEKSTAIASEKQ